MRRYQSGPPRHSSQANLTGALQHRLTEIDSDYGMRVTPGHPIKPTNTTTTPTIAALPSMKTPTALLRNGRQVWSHRQSLPCQIRWKGRRQHYEQWPQACQHAAMWKKQWGEQQRIGPHCVVKNKRRQPVIQHNVSVALHKGTTRYRALTREGQSHSVNDIRPLLALHRTSSLLIYQAAAWFWLGSLLII